MTGITIRIGIGIDEEATQRNFTNRFGRMANPWPTYWAKGKLLVGR